MIDPGLGRRNGETVLKEVAKVSKNADLFIVSTHFHPEHTTGYVAFPPSAKYVNSTTQEKEFEDTGMQMVKTFSGRSPLTAELLKDASRRRADITFDREYTLDLGGVRVRCLLVGPTHTRGDTGFFVEGDDVLFAGDVVMNESFLAAGPASSMKAWLAAFDAFEALKPRTIVPAHGAVGRWDGDRNEPCMGAAGARPGAGAEEHRASRSRKPPRAVQTEFAGTAPGMAARQRPRGAGARGIRGSVTQRSPGSEDRALQGRRSTTTLGRASPTRGPGPFEP